MRQYLIDGLPNQDLALLGGRRMLDSTLSRSTPDQCLFLWVDKIDDEGALIVLAQACRFVEAAAPFPGPIAVAMTIAVAIQSESLLDVHVLGDEKIGLGPGHFADSPSQENFLDRNPNPIRLERTIRERGLLPAGRIP